MNDRLTCRAAQRADALIARRERLAMLRWLPLAAIAGALLLPSLRQRAIALASASLLHQFNRLLKLR
jgi:hypothetical protein